MKKILIILTALFGINCQSQNQEVQKTIETFFEGFHARDSIKIKSVCSNKMILQSINENSKGTKLSYDDVGGFYKSIASIPAKLIIKEKILSFNIQIDGAMAHAWTPYEFYVNDQFSHKGVNSFTLFKENNIWKIINVIDTRRK